MRCSYDFTYPEYVPLFRHETLPQLTHFTLKNLSKQFFTLRELRLWGDKGGWEKLSELNLRDMLLFPAFSRRTPVLEELHLHAFEVLELYIAETSLEDAGIADPFP
jgi:hypothetical protein